MGVSARAARDKHRRITNREKTGQFSCRDQSFTGNAWLAVECVCGMCFRGMASGGGGATSGHHEETAW